MRYRGYYYDAETGFYYLQSRYYDPEIGRFINADSLVSTGQGIWGNNMFAYCLNNPVNCVDYFGNICCYISVGDRGMFMGPSLMGGCGGSFGTSAYPCTFFAESLNSEPQTYSLYETEESSLGGTFHGSVLENEMSALSVSNEGLTIIDASVSLIKGSWQWDDVIVEPYSCLNADASVSITKNGITVGAMASVWDLSGSFQFWGITITGTAHLGAAGGQFALGPKGFTWGGAGLFGFSISADW